MSETQSNTQKTNLIEAKQAEQTVLLIELDDAQIEVLKGLGIDVEVANKLAAYAFSSVLRGRVQGVMDKAIKMRYQAEMKGKKVLVEEFDREIQSTIRMKRSIS
jgi:hypothetical protein